MSVGLYAQDTEIDRQVEALAQREGRTSRNIPPAGSMSLRAA
jgi:hypothetical protein